MSDAPKEDDSDQREYLFKLMGAYSASAKTFVALATATLALTVTFREKVLGAHEGARWGELPSVGRWLLASSWLFLSVAILAGTFYEYLAVKFIERAVEGPQVVPPVFRRFVRAPGKTFGIMLVSFSLGALLFLAQALPTLLTPERVSPDRSGEGASPTSKVKNEGK